MTVPMGANVPPSLADSPAPDMAGRPAANARSAMRKIVIIDDLLTTALILRAHIEKIESVEPFLFTDPVVALDWCSKNRPDLILLDYIMPKMNGLEFLEAIRAMPDYDEVPVVMITALDCKEVLYRALELGANDFLNKPVDEIELNARTGNMLKLRARSLALAEANRHLRRLATTDGLTGTDNRHSFLERGAEEFERARRYGKHLSAVMLDADLFKRINDTYGHSAGDVVLVSVAATCRAVIRNLDCVGRLGGEEFGICLPETGLEAALAVAERLRDEIAANPVPFGTVRIAASVSIGVAEIGPDDRDFAGLLARADHALYRAKQSGRNCIRYG
jgi:two-component system cell cycle response regulator